MGMGKMKDPTTITAEEDEEQMIMRRLRNNVDELQRGYRWLGYMMKRVKSKAGESRYQRECIELMKEMVSTANELEEVKVQGFPTIKLFKKGTNEIVDYNGDRTEEGFSKFLEEASEAKAEVKDEL